MKAWRRENIANAPRLITNKRRKVNTMKHLKNNFRRSLAFMLAPALTISMFQFLGVRTPSALAASLTKNFSIESSPSGSVSFLAPAGVRVTAKVIYRRDGNTDIPITIEIEDPDGNIAATINEKASGSNQDVTLSASGNAKGCNPPWRVRVKTQNRQAPPAKVSGSVNFSFTDPGPIVSGPSQSFGVTQGNTVPRGIADFTSPGNLKITATWNSPVINSNGVDPAGLKLTFKLLQGNTVRAQSTGYAHNALLGNANPKMTINYGVTSDNISAGGDWKLNVIGSSGGDASDVKFTISFTPKCQ
jgi:hypothetical protein